MGLARLTFGRAAGSWMSGAEIVVMSRALDVSNQKKGSLMPRKKTPRKSKPAPRVREKRTTASEKKASNAKATNQRKQNQQVRLSALEAAVRVLQESGTSMNCRELIEAMAAKKYWQSPRGKTPERTLYAAIHRQIQQKGDQSRFRQVQRGRFALA